MICIENLTKRYGSLTALHELTLAVGAGEVFGLIGPNGAGKSTTLRILATLLAPTSGSVRIDGHVLAVEADRIRRIIGYMPDVGGVYEDMRVDEYLFFFAAVHGVTGAKAEGVVRDVLDLTDLAAKRDAPIEALSRGMRQRLGVALVLLHDPRVLLLDEPASGLDPRARIEMRELLRELRGMGKTVVISSHILSELAELCTSIGIIEGGRLLFQGPVEALTSRARRGVAHVRVGEPLPAADAGTEPAGGATERARAVLLADPRVKAATLRDGGLLEVTPEAGTDASFIPALLVGAGLRLRHFSEEPLSLEDAFLRLTRDAADVARAET